VKLDNPLKYEAQTDDPEVLDLLAGIEDILAEHVERISYKDRERLRRALRALVWRTLMDGES
jgi:hypothetical protein